MHRRFISDRAISGIGVAIILGLGIFAYASGQNGYHMASKPNQTTGQR